MERPRPGQIGHTCIRVQDIDATVRFYNELLGMPLVERREPPAFSMRMAALGAQENYLEVFQRREGETLHTTPEDFFSLPLSHFSLWVEDMEQLQERCAAAGFPFTQGGNIRTNPNWVGASIKVAWVKDPDDNRVEMLEWVGPAESQ